MDDQSSVGCTESAELTKRILLIQQANSVVGCLSRLDRTLWANEQACYDAALKVLTGYLTLTK